MLHLYIYTAFILGVIGLVIVTVIQDHLRKFRIYKEEAESWEKAFWALHNDKNAMQDKIYLWEEWYEENHPALYDNPWFKYPVDR